MTASPVGAPLAAAAVLALSLAGCAGTGTGYFGPSAEPPPVAAIAPPPPNMNPGDFVGRWGYAAYHRDSDRVRTEANARGQCNNAYTIGRGPTGGVLMHLADAREPQELRLKLGRDGKIYLGPEGPAPDPRDREILTFDGRLLVMRWVDPEFATRYGTTVYVRCGAPGTAAAKRKAGSTSARGMVTRTAKPHPEQGFRACLGILQLARSYGSARLEAACRRGNDIGVTSYGSIKSILQHGLDKAYANERPPHEPPIQHGNIRGSSYFH